MYKSVSILYLVVFFTYVLFTRQPDYFDGEITTGTIHWSANPVSGRLQPEAVFSTGKESYAVDAGYLFRKVNEGSTVKVIYELSQPRKAVVYSWWGYWITAGEVVFSIILLIILYLIAVAVTQNAVRQKEYSLPLKKRKYDDN